MMIIFPNATLVDTTGGALSFATTPAILQNANVVYTPASYAEWAYLQQEITFAAMSGATEINLLRSGTMTVGALSPGTVDHTVGGVISIAGTGFLAGATASLDYTFGSAQYAIKFAAVLVSDTELQITISATDLPGAGSGSNFITVFNPDGQVKVTAALTIT